MNGIYNFDNSGERVEWHFFALAKNEARITSGKNDQTIKFASFSPDLLDE